MAESSRRIPRPLERARALASEALAAAPAGLLTDFDGTLSPIASEPSLARLVEGADGALADLVDRLAVVAVVTGRNPLDARHLTGVPGLLIAGNHGIEWLEPQAERSIETPEASSVRERLDTLLAGLPAHPGVTLERKGLSATVHYRGAPDPNAALPLILEALGDTEELGIQLRHGRMSVELRPIGHGDKGSAAHAIIERFALQGVVVMGDDLTDLDMFRAVDELRSSGRIRGAIIGVGGADREVPDSVVAASDVVLADPAEAAALLLALADGPAPGHD